MEILDNKNSIDELIKNGSVLAHLKFIGLFSSRGEDVKGYYKFIDIKNRLVSFKFYKWDVGYYSRLCHSLIVNDCYILGMRLHKFENYYIMNRIIWNTTKRVAYEK